MRCGQSWRSRCGEVRSGMVGRGGQGGLGLVCCGQAGSDVVR